MLIQKKSLANILMIALIITITGLLFFFYEKINEEKYDVLDAVPESSSIFIRFGTFDQLYHSINENNIWCNILTLPGFSEFKEQIIKFDSLLHLKTESKSSTEVQNAIISIHSNNNNIDLLLVSKLDGTLSRKTLRTIFERIYGENYTTLISNVNGHQLNKLVFNQYTGSFTYAIEGGLFIGSPNANLVLESLENLQSDQSFGHNSTFLEVEKTAGKRVEANIFVNYKQLPSLLGQIANERYGITSPTDTINPNSTESSNAPKDFVGLNLLSNMAGWSELDLMIKKDEFFLSGYTSTNDSSSDYINLYKNQNEQPFEMAEIIPRTATVFQHFGIGNFEKYFTDYQNLLAKNERVDLFNQMVYRLNISLKTNLQNAFVPHVGPTFAFVSVATRNLNYEENCYAIIKMKNAVAAQLYLEQISKNKDGSGLVKKYRDHNLYHLNIEGFVPLVFGEPFSSIQAFHYTFIEDYLIIANSTSALEKYINLYMSGHPLSLDPAYISFADNMAEKSNFYFYFNIKKGLNLLERFINKNLYDFIIQNISTFKNYQALGLQYSSQENGLFTNLYLNYDANVPIQNDWAWQTKLDDNIVERPFLLRNHQDQYLYTLVADAGNQIYLVDHEGNILWKHKIDGQIMGEVHVVDFFKDGKLQYLFNTKTSIHLLDILGNKVGSYPIKLKVRAENGISVFDYSNNRDYRIIYAGTDQNIYNYTLDGKEVDGWNRAETDREVQGRIQHLVANNRDYILLADLNGNTRILNRQGSDRIILKSQFSKAENSEYYVNSTNNKGLFVTTDRTGKLIYISSKGNISSVDFGSFSENHFFLYEDFDQDENNDFIYIDKDKLSVFDRLKKEIFSYEFSGEISIPPTIYKASDGTIVLCVFSNTENKVYLFDKDGLIESNQRNNDGPVFSIGDLLNNVSINLLVGDDHILYNFLIR
ncbi:MAG: WD40 repeat domain-containing protein [Bacteroidetes bacterium]|nr:WD40 repeat domain-containing protein [Bacteroidota bacterium]